MVRSEATAILPPQKILPVAGTFALSSYYRPCVRVVVTYLVVVVKVSNRMISCVIVKHSGEHFFADYQLCDAGNGSDFKCL